MIRPVYRTVTERPDKVTLMNMESEERVERVIDLALCGHRDSSVRPADCAREESWEEESQNLYKPHQKGMNLSRTTSRNYLGNENYKGSKASHLFVL